MTGPWNDYAGLLTAQERKEMTTKLEDYFSNEEVRAINLKRIKDIIDDLQHPAGNPTSQYIEFLLRDSKYTITHLLAITQTNLKEFGLSTKDFSNILNKAPKILADYVADCIRKLPESENNNQLDNLRCTLCVIVKAKPSLKIKCKSPSQRTIICPIIKLPIIVSKECICPK